MQFSSFSDISDFSPSSLLFSATLAFSCACCIALISANLEFGLVSTFLLLFGLAASSCVSSAWICNWAFARRLSFSSNPFVIFLKSNRFVGISLSSWLKCSTWALRSLDFLGVVHVTCDVSDGQDLIDNGVFNASAAFGAFFLPLLLFS